MATKEAVHVFSQLLRPAYRAPAALQQRRRLCLQCIALGRTGPLAREEEAAAARSKRHVFRVRVAKRGMATMSQFRQEQYIATGPMAEYDRRVRSGRLRDDSHQRTIIRSLQDLHDVLMTYEPPKVVHPSIESLQPKRKGLFGSWFGGGHALGMMMPENLPKGLYMFGDVGSGKTMLMDLFYDTLSDNIQSKTRIHFHNFMQEVHKDLHKMKIQHGNDIDGIPFVAANIAEKASVLCFDEFQCTDVADAMILRRLMEALMSHGVVLVTTSNRHPNDLYKNGIQRESFIPCIKLLIERMNVINLDSTTDYRKIERPASGVYYHPLGEAARKHALHWFEFLGDFKNDRPHKTSLTVWGREIDVPRASGRACLFTFNELMGRATGAADYLELMKSFEAFIITDVPGMNYRSRDLARRFITFIDAVYESRAKLVLTTAVPLNQLFMSKDEVDKTLDQAKDLGVPEITEKASAIQDQQDAHPGNEEVNDAMRALMDEGEHEITEKATASQGRQDAHPGDAEVNDAMRSLMDDGEHEITGGKAIATQDTQGEHPEIVEVNDAMRSLMDDLGMNMTMLKNSSIFSGDEEAFAFARALSRLSEMGSLEWIERGLTSDKGGDNKEAEAARKVRSRWREDSY